MEMRADPIGLSGDSAALRCKRPTCRMWWGKMRIAPIEVFNAHYLSQLIVVNITDKGTAGYDGGWLHLALLVDLTSTSSQARRG